MNAEIDKTYFIVLATIGFVAFLVMTLFIFFLPGSIETGRIVAGLITASLAILMYPWQILDALNRKYTLGDKAVVYKAGVLTRYESEVPYTSIKGISIRQGIINRIVGCADIRITSPGIQDPHLISSADINSLCLRSIKNHKEISAFLRGKMEEYSDQLHSTNSATPAAS